MSLAVSGKVVDASFFGYPDGSVTITVINATPPYTILWNTGDTLDTITVAAGVYTVTVSDASSQTTTATFTVGQPLSFQLQLKPYDTALLSDQVTRDIFSRKIITAGFQLISQGKATIGLYLKGTTSTFSAIGTVTGSTEPDKSGGLMFSVYDQATPYDVLHITKNGVEINGNLTLTGTQTQINTSEIYVNDKTIHLNAYSSGGTADNGSGIIIGGTAPQTTFLYNSANDAFVSTAGLQCTDPSTSLRFGSDFANASTVLSSSNFKVSSNGNAIALDATGLTLTNCKLVNPVPITQQIASDVGLLNRPNGAFIGWNSVNNYWSTSGDPIHAPSFTTGSASFGASGITVPFVAGTVYNAAAVANNTVSLTGSGVNINNAVLLSQDGLDLDNKASMIYFGKRNWRILYNDVDNSIEFEKLTATGYISKLTLD